MITWCTMQWEYSMFVRLLTISDVAIPSVLELYFLFIFGSVMHLLFLCESDVECFEIVLDYLLDYVVLVFSLWLCSRIGYVMVYVFGIVILHLKYDVTLEYFKFQVYKSKIKNES
jgi:hypothetical protein